MTFYDCKMIHAVMTDILDIFFVSAGFVDRQPLLPGIQHFPHPTVGQPVLLKAGQAPPAGGQGTYHY